MTKYCEVIGNEPFDWNEFLIKKEYTYQELYQAWIEASSWVTCACGNQCSDIPRDAFGCPKDEELDRLGVRFTSYIHSMTQEHGAQRMYDFEGMRAEAIATLTLIELRSAYILRNL